MYDDIYDEALIDDAKKKIEELKDSKYAKRLKNNIDTISDVKDTIVDAGTKIKKRIMSNVESTDVLDMDNDHFDIL